MGRPQPWFVAQRISSCSAALRACGVTAQMRDAETDADLDAIVAAGDPRRIHHLVCDDMLDAACGVVERNSFNLRVRAKKITALIESDRM